MKKKMIVDDTPSTDEITTPRQLARLYMGSKLESFFVWSSLHFYRELDRPFKKQADDCENKIASQIINLVKQKRLNSEAVSLIESITDKNLIIYFALYDFGLAINNFQTCMEYIQKHNKIFLMEKKKALSYIGKLLNNYVVGVLDKKELERIKGKIARTPSDGGGKYYPLYFFEFLTDLGWQPGQKVDESYLQHKLDGLLVALHIKFQKNRRNDLFLFHALQIVIYDVLAQVIKIDRGKRYQSETTTRNRDAENKTASIINSYIQKVGLQGLPKLNGKAVYTTLHRNTS